MSMCMLNYSHYCSGQYHRPKDSFVCQHKQRQEMQVLCQISYSWHPQKIYNSISLATLAPLLPPLPPSTTHTQYPFLIHYPVSVLGPLSPCFYLIADLTHARTLAPISRLMVWRPHAQSWLHPKLQILTSHGWLACSPEWPASTSDLTCPNVSSLP